MMRRASKMTVPETSEDEGMKAPRILGLSASLRNARSRAGSANLVKELEALGTRGDLDTYIADQAKIHLDHFISAGRAEGKPFDELYRALRRSGGLKGLSNSEVCLVAALWGAREKGAEIDHVALADHFPADGSEIDVDALKSRLRAADGFILSAPVYFGDRGSISQRFVEMIRSDPALRADLAGKLYGGCAVGAKRNGGQETTLIYQMMDMINLGLLAVGNDSDTTSQYGGTAHAGDVGTIPKDEYGINTSIGTGRRIGRVARVLATGAEAALADPLRIGLWVLQDRDDETVGRIGPFLDELGPEVEVRTVDILGHRIRPCIACDICPTHVGPDEEYRCIIGRRDDGMKQMHEELLWPDVLMPAVYSPRERKGLVSVYQQFMERTRYLRRGDYVYTDRLVAPLVLAEVGANEHMDIRLMTSFIRHHTVMHRPVVAWLHEGRILNPAEIRNALATAAIHGRTLVQGRLGAAHTHSAATEYNPVGYVLSQARDREAATMEAREQLAAEREARLRDKAAERLQPVARKAAAANR